MRKKYACSSVNTNESNPTWILLMYQCSTLQSDSIKQKKNSNRDRFPVGLRSDIKSIKRKQIERIQKQ